MTRMKSHMIQDRPNPLDGLRTVAAALALIGLLIGTAGCDEQKIKAYQAPKAEPLVEQPLFSAPDGAGRPEARITWDVPEGWDEPANSSPILTAVFEVKGDAGPVRITVTKLTNDGGGVVANINRWRGQVGLGPIEVFEDQPMTPIQIGKDTAGVIDLAAPQGADTGLERLMVVFIPRRDQGLTWYFKMSGASATVDEQAQAFAAFVGSVRFETPTMETDEPQETPPDTAEEASESEVHAEDNSGAGGGGE